MALYWQHYSISEHARPAREVYQGFWQNSSVGSDAWAASQSRPTSCGLGLTRGRQTSTLQNSPKGVHTNIMQGPCCSAWRERLGRKLTEDMRLGEGDADVLPLISQDSPDL